jgi:transposase
MVSTHHGKAVRAWWQRHPRFVFHFPPLHCSWMTQVEQWFASLQRKRLRIADFASKAVLQAQIEPFLAEWHAGAHPCNWSKKSVAKLMADPVAKAA